MKIAFIGNKGLGGVKMRGVAAAKAMGVDFLDLRQLRKGDRFDVLILVKYWTYKRENYGKLIRSCCDRLIFDPLDCWSSTKPNAEIWQFWKWCNLQLYFDDIFATSPACVEAMANTPTISKALIHLLPHHADPSIDPSWYDPDGPIVYAGGIRFIQHYLVEIQDACQAIGRKLIIDVDRDAQKSLRGAALCLHTRFRPHDTPLNRHCKPQVKLENAAAAGMPVLASDDPCVYRKEAARIPQSGLWDENIQNGLKSKRLTNPVTLESHVEKLKEIIFHEHAAV